MGIPVGQVDLPSVATEIRDHEQRILDLEAQRQQAGSYLQAKGACYGGAQFQAITALNSFTGGNGTDVRGGNWQWQSDATCPFNGIRLATDTDGDWFPFCVGNLGPRYSGYSVAVWYYRDSDAPKLEIEWATGPIDEFGGTTPPVGSATSILGPNDQDLYDAALFDWYNTDNAGDIGFSYKWDAYKASSPVWDCVVGRSPFHLAGVDGTPLTANAVGDSDWETSKAFNGGGGPDLAWWMRILVNGRNASNVTGFNAKIGQIWVYRTNGAADFVGGG